MSRVTLQHIAYAVCASMQCRPEAVSIVMHRQSRDRPRAELQAPQTLHRHRPEGLPNQSRLHGTHHHELSQSGLSVATVGMLQATPWLELSVAVQPDDMH